MPIITLTFCLPGLYALGKESLLLELAMEFKTWVEVSFERMETLRALELPDVFTTDQGAGRIRAVEQSEICFASLQRWNKEQPTLAILPTSRPLVSFHPNVHVVPYSDHSSYQELEDFVSALQPTCIAPIVGKCMPGSLSTLQRGTKCLEILVPESVQQYMLRQPKSLVSSSVCTSLHHRPLRPVAPKGVIFESPEKASLRSHVEAWEAECQHLDASEEEMEAEGSERDSDCVLIDVSEKLTANENREGAGDIWSLNIVQTVSEDVVITESMTNTKAGWKPAGTRKRLQSGKVISKTASSENYTSQHSGQGDIDSHTLSDAESTGQDSGHGINQDRDIISNYNHISQQNCPGNNSCSSSSSFIETIEDYFERLDNSILNSLPFTEEDLKTGGVQQQDLLHHYPLCPLNEAGDE